MLVARLQHRLPLRKDLLKRLLKLCLHTSHTCCTRSIVWAVADASQRDRYDSNAKRQAESSRNTLIKTGVGAAILPTSSSACIMRLIRADTGLLLGLRFMVTNSLNVMYHTRGFSCSSECLHFSELVHCLCYVVNAKRIALLGGQCIEAVLQTSTLKHHS